MNNVVARPALESPRWRAVALDKIMTSGFILCLTVVAMALYLFVVFHTPAWHAGIAVFFGICMLIGRQLIQKYLVGSAVVLIITMYLGAIAIKFLVDKEFLSDFGIFFLYTIPLLALILISRQVAHALKLVNFIPFVFVIVEHFLTAQAKNELPVFNYVYLHLLMFVFFNFILPFAMQQMVQEAWQGTAIRRKAHQSIMSRKKLYQTLFKLSRQPSLIVKHSDNTIVDSNDALKRICYGNALLNLRDFILSQDMKFDQAYDVTLVNRHFLVWRKPIEHSSNHLYVLEEVTQLKRLTSELTELTHKSKRQQLEDPNTRLPSREALAMQIVPLQTDEKLSFLICAKPELSEYYSRRMTPDEFHNRQLKYSDYIQQQLMSNFVAKISRHLFGFIVFDHSIESIRSRIKKLYSDINELQGGDTGEISGISKFSFSTISASTCDARYLIDQTENKLMQAGLGEYLINYEPEHDDEKFKHLTLRSSLERAIDRNELSIVLQPKVTENGELSEFEALLRWRNGDSFIPPSKFIPLAEQSGMVGRITDWLIDQVCRFLSDQVNSGSRIFPISINISAMDLERSDFVDTVLRCLNQYSVSPTLLGIELTETALLKNDDNAIEQLRKLRFWGLRVSIDDFGVGYSSLSRIVEFPIDVLKLDRSFLFKLDQDNRRLILIQAMVTLCHNLDIQVVAEGVETLEELNKLSSFSPVSFQGYYFSKPLELPQVVQLCADSNVNEPITFPLTD